MAPGRGTYNPLYMQGVPVVLDADQDSTDLMKCLANVLEEEKASGAKVRYKWMSTIHVGEICVQYNVLVLGGLGGRLDQSIHTLSYFHKQRKLRRTMMALTDESLAWVLDAARLVQSSRFRDANICRLGRALYPCRSDATRTHMWTASRGGGGF